MRMRFDAPEDEDAAQAAREDLVAWFGKWLEAHPEHRPAEAWDVDLLLGWKWGYGDGDYGRWARVDVDEVLLDHLPRKLSALPEEAASIPSSLAAFVRFLDEEGLLAADSDPADAVASRALAQQRAFLDAMDDPANFGMAKRLFGSLGLGGDDLPDQAALDAAVARFNDLPRDERDEILGRVGPGGAVMDDEEVDLPALPLRAMPSAESLAARAADVPLLRQVDAFANALGPAGAKVTKAGNLTLADGRQLVASTGVEDRVEGIRSTAELPQLFAVAQVAQEAGAVEVVGNRLRGVEAWGNLPVGVRWQRVVDAVLQAGAATLAFGAALPSELQLAELADQLAVHMLAMLWIADEPVPRDVVVDMMDEMVDEVAELESLPLDTIGSVLGPDWTRATCRARIDDVLARLSEAGVVVTDNDRVALAEAGATLCGPTLREVGFGVLLPDELAACDAAALIDALAEWDGDDVATAAQIWSAGRAGGRASQELVAELLARPEPVRVLVGFSILQHLGPEATDAVRGLLDGPLAGHAWLFLADRGAADGEMPLDLVAQTGVDLFAATAELGSPADVVEMVLNSVPPGEHTAFIDVLSRADRPETGALLELLGRHHPDKTTAKHARKAAHRWRSGHGHRG